MATTPPIIIPSSQKNKPIFEWGGIPTSFKSKYHEDKWWDTERKRCLEGYGPLTGRHYFTVTQGTYKDARNHLISPLVRDGDILVFEEYEYAKKKFKDLFIAKRRGFALSSIFGAALPMYESLYNPGSTNLITSADKSRLEELHKDKILVFYQNLNGEIKPETISSRQSGYLHFGYKDGDGGIGGLNSKIMCIQTTDRPSDVTNFEAFRATTAFIDEVFLHPRPDEVVASAQASMMSGFIKVNPIVLGGSAGVASTAGAMRMQEYWLDAEFNEVHTLFLPGTLCITEAPEYDQYGEATGRVLNFCPNGRSLQKEADEYILRTRDKLARATNKKKLLQFIKAFPRTIEEVFDVNTKSIFTEDVNEILNETSARVKSERTPVTRWDLHRDSSGIIKPELNPTSGDFYIYQHPVKDVIYGAGNDPIPFGHEDQTLIKRSLNSTCIGNIHTMSMEAYYMERTHDSDLAMDKSLRLMDYYNAEKIMIERNRGQMLIESFKKDGRSLRLAREPAFMNPTKKLKPIGWYKEAISSQTAAGELISFIKKHHLQINIPEFIDQLRKFGAENTDLVDAWVSFLLLARGIKEDIDRDSLHNKIMKKTTHVTIRNGKRVVEEKTIYQDSRTGKAMGISRPDVFNHGR
jgi:hypothetical protein